MVNGVERPVTEVDDSNVATVLRVNAEGFASLEIDPRTKLHKVLHQILRNQLSIMEVLSTEDHLFSEEIRNTANLVIRG